MGRKPRPAETVAGERHVDIDLQDLHFKHIAGLGFGDGDRTGENMAARALILDLVVNIGIVRRNVSGRDAFALPADPSTRRSKASGCEPCRRSGP